MQRVASAVQVEPFEPGASSEPLGIVCLDLHGRRQQMLGYALRHALTGRKVLGALPRRTLSHPHPTRRLRALYGRALMARATPSGVVPATRSPSGFRVCGRGTDSGRRLTMTCVVPGPVMLSAYPGLPGYLTMVRLVKEMCYPC